MLLLKLIFYVLLAYLLVRAVANLLRVILQQQDVSAGPSRPGRGTGRGTGRHDASGGDGRRKRDERATRLRDDDEDVEDARWEDL